MQGYPTDSLRGLGERRILQKRTIPGEVSFFRMAGAARSVAGPNRWKRPRDADEVPTKQPPLPEAFSIRVDMGRTPAKSSPADQSKLRPAMARQRVSRSGPCGTTVPNPRFQSR